MGHLTQEAAKKLVEGLAHWHGKISRERVEALLKDKAPGTYLLRKDPEGFDDEILLENTEADFVFILSVAEKGRIAEHFIFHTDKGWVLSNDEPRFANCRAHHALHTLIDSVITILKHRVA